jgi:hypothetical protein
VDCDGEMWETPIEEVENFLTEIFAEARRRGTKAVEAAIENNKGVIDAIRASGNVAVAINLDLAFAEHNAKLAMADKPKRHRATKAEMEERRRVANAAQQQDPPSTPDGGASSASPLVPPAGDPTVPTSPVMAQTAGDAPHPTSAAAVDPEGKRSEGDGPANAADVAPAEEPGTSSEAKAEPVKPGNAGEAGGSPAIPYEVHMPLGEPATALRTWALALLPPRLRKCADKAEAAIVLDTNDRHIKAYTQGLSHKQYKDYQADLDAIIERLP